MSVVYDEKLLDKTGLAMVPSAYKGAADENNAGGFLGKVYSVLPAQTTSDNLVTNGTFDTDSDWTKGTGWSIDNGVATYDNFGTAANLRQDGIVEIGKTYILKFDTLGDVSGNFGYALGGTVTFFTGIQPNKTYEVEVVATDNDLRLRASSNFAGSIDNVSVRRVINGDFDFSRGSDATRVNKDGLVESVQIASGELVQNGGFDTTLGSELVQNADFEEIGDELITNRDFSDGENGWTTNSWEVSGGKLILPATSTDNANQNVNIVQNKLYKIDFDISNLSNGGLRVRLGLGDMSQTITSNGNHTVYLQHTTTNNVFRVYSDTSGEFDGSIDNISVKEVGQNWDLDSGWSISEGQAVCDGIGINSIQQSGITEIGKIYKVSFDVLDSNDFNFLLISNNFSDTYIDADLNNSVVVGTNTFYIKPTNGTGLRFRVENGTTLTIDNISVKEVQGLDDWNFTSGATFNDGEVALSSSANISQNCGLISGKKYKVKYDITSIDAGSSGITAYIGSSGAGARRTQVGTYTEDVICSGVLSLYFFTGGAFVSGTIDNISVVEVTDDTDIPRLDYSDGCPSLLLEPQRTNLIEYSEDFSEWDGGATLNANNIISPDGFRNGTEFVNASTGLIYYSFDCTELTDYTFSFYAKKGTSDNTYIATRDNTNGNFIDLDLPYESSEDEWTRVTHTFTTPAGCVNARVYLHRYSANSAGTFYYWGAQIEEGSYATSYIPTNGETNGVTRRADVCNNAGDSTIFNDDEGVLFVDMAALANDGTNRIFGISDGGSFDNSVLLRFSSVSNRITAQVRLSGVYQCTLNFEVTDATQFNKVAFKYKENDFSLFVNGVERDSHNSGSIVTGLDELAFDFVSGNVFYGKVKSILYFNEALSDAELEYITSSDIDVVLQNNKLKATMLGDTYEDDHVEDRLNELF
jgi:hypothetical protein